MIVKTTWKDNMEFDSEINGHHIILDANASVGGNDKGPRPKGLMLTALTGCTGMDVVSILKKMKVQDYKFWMEADADPSEEHPVYYTKIYLTYQFEGDDLPIDKIKKAVNLSEERYCGVSFMLKKAAELETKIIVNGEEI
ncbi:OsmC family protein [bacterium]|nr:OsmC family protein [bacterium]